jgi:N-acetylmuramoyl-L-alanine amidase
MKLKNVSFAILMLKMCIIFGQNHVAEKIIIIDPRHGGKDTGAIGINDIQEKDVVLDIAKEILRLNKTIFNNQLDIYLTRYKDTLISLSDRSRLTKGIKADVFLSLHCNASRTTSKGMEVYLHNSDNLNTKQSISLGLAVINESMLKLGFKKRGVKFANFQVLRETSAFCPAILVELGFVTNSDEADYFLKPSNIKAMALAVLMGLYNYLITGL